MSRIPDHITLPIDQFSWDLLLEDASIADEIKLLLPETYSFDDPAMLIDFFHEEGIGIPKSWYQEAQVRSVVANEANFWTEQLYPEGEIFEDVTFAPIEEEQPISALDMYAIRNNADYDIETWLQGRLIDEIHHIDKLRQETPFGFSELTLHFFSAYLRGICLSDEAAIYNLNIMISELCDVSPEVANWDKNELKLLFDQALDSLGFDETSLSSLRQMYLDAEVPVTLSHVELVGPDPVSQFYIQLLLSLSQENPESVFLSKLQEADSNSSVQNADTHLKGIKTELETIRKRALRIPEGFILGDVLNSFDDLSVRVHLYENVLGVSYLLVEQVRRNNTVKPAGFSMEDWELAKYIVRCEQESKKSFVMRDFQTSHIPGQDSFGYYMQSPMLAEPTFEIAAPVLDPVDQLDTVSEELMAIYAESSSNVDFLLDTNEHGISNFIVHLFKLSLIPLNSANNYHQDLDLYLRRFLEIVTRGNDRLSVVVTCFFDAFKEMRIDGQKMEDWMKGRENQRYLRTTLGSDQDSVTNLLTLPSGYDRLAEELMQREPSIVYYLRGLERRGDGIFQSTGIDYLKVRPVAFVRQNLINMKDDTDKAIKEITTLVQDATIVNEAQRGVFKLIDQYCPSMEGRQYLLSKIGVDYRLLGQTVCPSWMGEDQWTHTQEFGIKYHAFGRSEQTKQMVTMGVFMFACFAASFFNPLLGTVVGLAAGGVFTARDIHHEYEKYRTTGMGAFASEIDGNPELASVEDMLRAQTDYRDSCWMGYFTMMSIAANVGVSAYLKANISRNMIRIPLDLLYAGVDGAAIAYSDPRGHRNGNAGQMALVAALFSAAGAGVGEGVAALSGQKGVGRFGQRQCSFDGRFGEMPGGRYGVSFDNGSGRLVFIDVDPQTKLKFDPETKTVLLAQNSDVDIKMRIVDDASGRVTIDVEDWSPVYQRGDTVAAQARESARAKGMPVPDGMEAGQPVSRTAFADFLALFKDYDVGEVFGSYEQAKRAGIKLNSDTGNEYSIFRAVGDNQAEHFFLLEGSTARVALESLDGSFRAAIDKGDFNVFNQPVAHIHTRDQLMPSPRDLISMATIAHHTQKTCQHAIVVNTPYGVKTLDITIINDSGHIRFEFDQRQVSYLSQQEQRLLGVRAEFVERTVNKWILEGVIGAEKNLRAAMPEVVSVEVARARITQITSDLDSLVAELQVEAFMKAHGQGTEEIDKLVRSIRDDLQFCRESVAEDPASVKDIIDEDIAGRISQIRTRQVAEVRNFQSMRACFKALLASAGFSKSDIDLFFEQARNLRVYSDTQPHPDSSTNEFMTFTLPFVDGTEQTWIIRLDGPHDTYGVHVNVAVAHQTVTNGTLGFVVHSGGNILGKVGSATEPPKSPKYPHIYGRGKLEFTELQKKLLALDHNDALNTDLMREHGATLETVLVGNHGREYPRVRAGDAWEPEGIVLTRSTAPGAFLKDATVHIERIRSVRQRIDSMRQQVQSGQKIDTGLVTDEMRFLFEGYYQRGLIEERVYLELKELVFAHSGRKTVKLPDDLQTEFNIITKSMSEDLNHVATLARSPDTKIDKLQLDILQILALREGKGQTKS